jgi:hypothetical protein
LESLAVRTACLSPHLKPKMLRPVSADRRYYMREILRDFGYAQTAPTNIYEDNLACVAMSENSVRRKFSRNIDIIRYFVRDMVAAGVINPFSFAARTLRRSVGGDPSLFLSLPAVTGELFLLSRQGEFLHSEKL